MTMTTEFLYTWPDGRIDVRYRRPKDSKDAIEFMNQIDSLNKVYVDAGLEPSNYSYRDVNDVTEYFKD